MKSSHISSFLAISDPFRRWRDYYAKEQDAILSALSHSLAWADADEAKVLAASDRPLDLLYWLTQKLPRDYDSKSVWEQWRWNVDNYLSLIREIETAIPKSTTARKLKVELLAFASEAEQFACEHERKHRAGFAA